MARIAERLQQFDSKAFRDVFALKAQLKHPIDLSVGVPEELTSDHIKLAGITAIGANHTSYTATNGILPLRQALAKKLKDQNNIKLTPEQVTIVPGLTTGLLLVYMALLNPGDEVIVIDPSYPPYFSLPPMIGARAVRVSSFPTFELDPTAIEHAITDKTRVIIINSPNNPTGAVYSEQALRQVAAVARAYNLLVISDEIYEHFVHEGEHFSIGSIYPNTITMNGFSKNYAMTGWRLGYVAGPEEIIAAINQLQQYTVFSSSTIAQYAALAALTHPLNPALTNYRAKQALVTAALKSMDYAIHGGTGAYYVLFPTPEGVRDVEFIQAAAKHNVLLIPGHAFAERQDYVRLSYGADLDTLAKGLTILQDVTRELRQTP